mgnify:CR=1 FL=1
MLASTAGLPPPGVASLSDRQLRQVPRFLGQSRYNGPPQTSPGSKPILPPYDYANNPSMTSDGASVVFDAYRATIPEAVKLGGLEAESDPVEVSLRVLPSIIIRELQPLGLARRA